LRTTGLAARRHPAQTGHPLRARALRALPIFSERRTAMMIARWSIDAKFGYKQSALDLMNRWADDIGVKVGWTRDKMRLLTGSVGAPESTIQSEVTVKDLGELSAAWEKLGNLEAHRQWGKELEPFVVSGSNRWEIFRVIE
jgi:hypothetical protein